MRFVRLLVPAVIATACLTYLVPLRLPGQNTPSPANRQWAPGTIHTMMGDHIPDFSLNPDLVSVRSGRFCDPKTWSTGKLPTATQAVNIKAGHEVVIDCVDCTVRSLSVLKDGKLKFATGVRTRLYVAGGYGALFIKGGELEIGTVVDPIKSSTVAEVIFGDNPIDTTWDKDPAQFGNGLLVLDGKVSICGSPRTGFVRLKTAPKAGDVVLNPVSMPSGWQPGDVLLLPDTREGPDDLEADRYGPYGDPHWELVELAGSSNDGKIVLRDPLRFDHPSTMAGDVELIGHVANLTRNVWLYSENTEGTRGHSLFHGNCDVEIKNTQFYGMGRTTTAPIQGTAWDSEGALVRVGNNQPGRYGIHLHGSYGRSRQARTGDGYENVVSGNAFWECQRWGCAIHNTHNSLFSDNVGGFNHGCLLMVESGNERWNRISRNFAAVTLGEGATGQRDGDLAPERGYEGVPFWFGGINNYVVDNVACNSQSHGYDVFLFPPFELRTPLHPNYDPQNPDDWAELRPNQFRTLEWDRNETYCNRNFGIHLWYEFEGSNYDGLVSWHNPIAFAATYTNGAAGKNWLTVGGWTSVAGAGFGTGDPGSGLFLDNCRLYTYYGVYLPAVTNLGITNSYFDNIPFVFWGDGPDGTRDFRGSRTKDGPLSPVAAKAKPVVKPPSTSPTPPKPPVK